MFCAEVGSLDPRNVQNQLAADLAAMVFVEWWNGYRGRFRLLLRKLNLTAVLARKVNVTGMHTKPKLLSASC